MTTDTKAPNSVRHLPSFAQTLRDEADKCDLFGITRPAELLRDAAAIIAEAQPDHISGAGKMVPLTNEQIDALAESAFDAFMRDGNDDYDRAFARFIERAHGIGIHYQPKPPHEQEETNRHCPAPAGVATHLQRLAGPV